jgi:hypothetical protein
MGFSSSTSSLTFDLGASCLNRPGDDRANISSKPDASADARRPTSSKRQLRGSAPGLYRTGQIKVEARTSARPRDEWTARMAAMIATEVVRGEFRRGRRCTARNHRGHNYRRRSGRSQWCDGRHAAPHVQMTAGP